MKATLFQQHLCKLGQLRRSNSQVFGQAMKKRPTGHYKKYSHFKGRDTAPITSSREGSCIVDSSTSGERTLLCSSNPGPVGSGVCCTRAILSRDRTEDDETFCTALPIIYVYNLCTHTHTRARHQYYYTHKTPTYIHTYTHIHTCIQCT